MEQNLKDSEKKMKEVDLVIFNSNKTGHFMLNLWINILRKIIYSVFIRFRQKVFFLLIAQAEMHHGSKFLLSVQKRELSQFLVIFYTAQTIFLFICDEKM